MEIKRRGFAGNRRLRKVVFPYNLERIGAQCYRECSNLRSVEFEKNSRCKVISEGIFDSCTRLEKVYLPETVKIIEKRAFYRCKELKNRWAFHGCNRLERIEIFHDPDEIGPWIINKSCTIVCQKGSRIDAYAQEYGFQTEYVEISEELDG